MDGSAADEGDELIPQLFNSAEELLQHAERFEARTREAASALGDFESIVSDLQVGRSCPNPSQCVE